MTEIPVDTPGTVPSSRYAADADVRLALGKLGTRLPDDLDVAGFGSMAHADVVDVLSASYPDGVPTFSGVGADVVRWAEARLAAAAILEVLRVTLGVTDDTPATMRAEALERLADGVPGYPAGSTTTDGANGGTVVVAGPRPRVSSFTPVSVVPDPYAELRGVAGYGYL